MLQLQNARPCGVQLVMRNLVQRITWPLGIRAHLNQGANIVLREPQRAGMLGVEIIAGQLAASQTLHADALDFFADALTYCLSLAVIGAPGAAMWQL
jgi:hypothetical protein